MKSNKAYKFRLYPNEAQAKQLDNNLGSCRFVFNYFLALSKETYDLDYNKTIGLDYSNQEMFVCSDNLQFDKEFIKIYRSHEERLHFLQQTLSRRKKANHKQNEESSKRYEKQRRKVAKFHEYLRDQGSGATYYLR